LIFQQAITATARSMFPPILPKDLKAAGLARF
jgi:hypothetical protein